MVTAAMVVKRRFGYKQTHPLLLRLPLSGSCGHLYTVALILCFKLAPGCVLSNKDMFQLTMEIQHWKPRCITMKHSFTTITVLVIQLY